MPELDQDSPDSPRLHTQIAALSRRFTELSGHVDAIAGGSRVLVKEALEELGIAVEELEVLAEEMHLQNAELAATRLELEAESQRYQDLFELCPDAYVVTDRHGIILEANPAAQELAGPSRVVRGAPLFVFVHRDDRRLLLTALHEAGDRESAVAFDARFEPMAGRPFHASVTLRGTADKASGNRVLRWVIRDISDRVGAEAALTESEELFRLIAENASDVVLAADADHRVTFISPAVTSLLCVDPADVVGTDIIQWIHPRDRAAWEMLRANVAASGMTETFSVRVVRGKAPPATVECRIGRFHRGDQVDADDLTAGTWAAMRDVTERERARAELQTALTREQDLVESLREADATKDAFLLAVSHDVRNPVAAIAAGSETLLSHWDDLSEPDAKDLVGAVRRNAERLVRILANLLDVERLAGGALAASRTEVDLGELVERAAQQCEVPAERWVLEVLDPPARAAVDGGLVERIVDNLLRNAHKFAPEGTIVAVRVEATAGGGARLTVDDEGPGVPDDQKSTIFAAFTRADAEPRSGLGLGLYLVRRFAELHGGRAWVEDRPGGGASFRIELPPPE